MTMGDRRYLRPAPRSVRAGATSRSTASPAAASPPPSASPTPASRSSAPSRPRNAAPDAYVIALGTNDIGFVVEYPPDPARPHHADARRHRPRAPRPLDRRPPARPPRGRRLVQPHARRDVADERPDRFSRPPLGPRRRLATPSGSSTTASTSPRSATPSAPPSSPRPASPPRRRLSPPALPPASPPRSTPARAARARGAALPPPTPRGRAPTDRRRYSFRFASLGTLGCWRSWFRRCTCRFDERLLEQVGDEPGRRGREARQALDQHDGRVGPREQRMDVIRLSKVSPTIAPSTRPSVAHTTLDALLRLRRHEPRPEERPRRRPRALWHVPVVRGLVHVDEPLRPHEAPEHRVPEPRVAHQPPVHLRIRRVLRRAARSPPARAPSGDGTPPSARAPASPPRSRTAPRSPPDPDRSRTRRAPPPSPSPPAPPAPPTAAPAAPARRASGTPASPAHPPPRPRPPRPPRAALDPVRLHRRRLATLAPPAASSTGAAPDGDPPPRRPPSEPAPPPPRPAARPAHRRPSADPPARPRPSPRAPPRAPPSPRPIPVERDVRLLRRLDQPEPHEPRHDRRGTRARASPIDAATCAGDAPAKHPSITAVSSSESSTGAPAYSWSRPSSSVAAYQPRRSSLLCYLHRGSRRACPSPASSPWASFSSHR